MIFYLFNLKRYKYNTYRWCHEIFTFTNIGSLGAKILIDDCIGFVEPNCGFNNENNFLWHAAKEEGRRAQATFTDIFPFPWSESCVFRKNKHTAELQAKAGRKAEDEQEVEVEEEGVV